MSPFEENRPTFCQTEHVRRVLKYNFYPQTCINRGFVRHSREASFPMFFSARTHRAINCIPDFRSNRAIIVGNNEVLFSAVPLTSPRGPLSKSLVRQVARSEKLELRASERRSRSEFEWPLHRFSPPVRDPLDTRNRAIRDPPGHFFRIGIDKREKVPQ